MVLEEIPELLRTDSPPPYSEEDTSNPPPSYEQGNQATQPGTPSTKKKLPPLQEILGLIPGYEHIGFQEVPLELPPAYACAATCDHPLQTSKDDNVPTISEAEAREALLEHVSHHCCYGKAPAHGLEFSDMNSSAAYVYQLETYTEKRTHKLTFTSYYPGNKIDGPSGGNPPEIWEIPVEHPAYFIGGQREIPVPHTDKVKLCFDCQGKAKHRCLICYTSGKVYCGSCGGVGGESVTGYDGERHYQTCMWCSGRGIRRCGRCDGRGYLQCSTCDGCGHLKYFILLTVTWQTHVNRHLCNETPLPHKLANKAAGHIVFKEEYSRLCPVQDSPSSDINQASDVLIKRHQAVSPYEKVIRQRHYVKLVPVTHAQYKWKLKTHEFFVYGRHHHVHAPNYPQRCIIL